MKRYEITIRWRLYRWHLKGVARSSTDLVAGLIGYFGPDTYISVRAV